MSNRKSIPQQRRDRFRQIVGDQPHSQSLSGQAVQPDGGAAGFECRHALSQKAGDQPGQHVA